MNNSATSCLRKPNRIARLYAIAFALVVLAGAIGLLLGSTRLSASDWWGFFTEGAASSAGARVIAFVRLPRTLASLVCGAALSAAGAVIQGVLANRLASPSVVGVNAGAGLAVTMCTAFGILGGWQVSLFAFLGAFATVMLVSLAAQKWGVSRATVILIGVAVNSLLGAVSDAIVTFFPEVGVMSNDFKVGEFSAITYAKLIPAAVAIVVTVLLLLTLHHELDVLRLGEDSAKGLGMNTALTRTLFLALAALLAGCAVSLAGLLSFVGLMVPHAVRRLVGNLSLHLIALSALLGAGFVCLCDTLSRTVFTPYEVPVGILMAFLGAPFFVFLLIKGKGGRADA